MLLPLVQRETAVFAPSALVTASFGGGTNSTAMLVEIATNDKHAVLRPRLITFADTGGERPETYDYIGIFSEWLGNHGLPPITVVRKVTKDGTIKTLEQDCLDNKMLPSIAYGFKSCSQKYKVQPQDKYTNNWLPARAAWARGEKIVKLIGYDAGEERRAKYDPDKKYVWHYPLIEWGWVREDCVKAIERVGLRLPGKSACFFCPNSRASELVQLQSAHPDLMRRALKMESNANLVTIKGLGRRFAWSDFVTGQSCSIPAEPEAPCGCYDGEDSDSD